jgi:hypothetical protein
VNVILIFCVGVRVNLMFTFCVGVGSRSGEFYQ